MQSLILLFIVVIGIIALTNFVKSMIIGLDDDEPKSNDAANTRLQPLKQKPQIKKSPIVGATDTINVGTANAIKVGCPFCQSLVDIDARQCPSCDMHFS